MRRATLVTFDPATGLRRSPIRWPDGKPPTPFGCRRCGHPENRHGLGWHQWERPTREQILARMKARRERRQTARELAVLGIPVIDTKQFLATVQAIEVGLNPTRMTTPMRPA